MFALSLAAILGTLVVYINVRIKPDNMETVKRQSIALVESKASEVGMWIYRKVSEFRVLAQVPAVKAVDVRGIAPLIDNLTESFKRNGDTMETFAYGGFNSFSGFNWVNADAILDLIVYEDYVALLNSGMEYSIGTPITTADNRDVILFYYPVPGYNGKYEGLLCSAVPTVRLKEIVNTMHVYEGKTWLMNQEGTILTTSSSYFYERILGKEQIERLPGMEEPGVSGYLPTVNASGEKCTLFYAPVPHSRDWLFCALVNDTDIYRNINGMMKGLLGMCLFLLVSSVFLGILLARSVEKPIQCLQGRMDQVERGNMNAYFDRRTKDEIYYLGVSYNRMLDQINKLIGRIYEEQKLKRKSELQVLQGQIKPHFLYNTLDNLKWMAKQYGAEDIAKTITSLSTFFRVFLSEGEEEITLEQEFRHTRSYLEIQQMRYKQLLTFEMDLEDDIRDQRIIKIIVQPLVENAIYHGIKNKRDRGRILVRGFRRDDRIRIVVQDDGIGMKPEKLAELLSSLDSEDRNGHYGVRNIRERLRLAYGEQTSFMIESVFEEGTVVTLEIPLQQEDAS